MMRGHGVCVCLTLAGCDSSSPSMMQDAPLQTALTVQVTSPNGGESYYPSTSVRVQWIATGQGSLLADVELLDGGTALPVASDVASTSGTMASVMWTASVPQSSGYRVRVTVTDDTNATVSDTSDADFAIRPPQAVSLASQLQPILNASCDGTACHDMSQPQAGLDLTQGNAHAELVDVASSQCASVKRVAPNSPEQSYLIWKLDGAGQGTCYVGTEMPKGQKLPLAQIQLFRDWIANGAPNN